MVKRARIVALAALMGGCAQGTDLPGDDTLAIFHNASGSMCLDALAWLATIQSDHPELAVEEYLTTNADNLAILAELESRYGRSQGVSTTFGYLPLIFYGGQAFSGFNDEIQDSLEGLIASANGPSP